MPETAAINDKYQVKIVGRIEEQETNNIIHFSSLNGDTDVELHLIVVIIACFVTHLLPGLASGWELRQVVWKRVSPTLGPENVTLPTGLSVGTLTTDALPSLISAVISIRTSFGGKSGRGRMYLAGLPEANVLGSKIVTESVTWEALVAFCACIASSFVPNVGLPGANSWAMQIYSRKLGGATFPYGAVGFHTVTTLIPDGFVGTTRSRKVGRGS